MAEYIDKDIALNLISNRLETQKRYSDYYDGVHCGLDCALGIIEDIPAADVAPVKHGKWISVKERLPEEHENVLVAVKSPFFVTLLNIDEMEYDEVKEEKTWLLHERGDYKITHWMPLPEPPKEAEE